MTQIERRIAKLEDQIKTTKKIQFTDKERRMLDDYFDRDMPVSLALKKKYELYLNSRRTVSRLAGMTIEEVKAAIEEIKAANREEDGNCLSAE